MYETKDELDCIEGKLLKNQTDFLIKKVTAGSVTIIPDPDPIWPKRSGSTTLIMQQMFVVKRNLCPKNVPTVRQLPSILKYF
jgi:hypothetical protein